jgi:RNA polymerase sigma-70 factor (ECF subfamily)
MSDTNYSFDNWLDRLREGHESAHHEVFRRFAGQLLALARNHLDQRIRHIIEPDDVLQSALRSFFVHNAEGQYRLDNWNSLWGLVALITVRKCNRQNERFHTARRDVSRMVAPPALQDSCSVPWEAVDHDPTPEEAVSAAETVELLMREENDRGRQILTQRLQDYTEEEICRQVGCSERTVRRVLERARKRLQSMLA